MESQISTLLSNLADNDDKLSVMTDVLIYLNSTGSLNISELGDHLHFNVLFDCLGSESELDSKTCQVLSRLLEAMKPQAVFKLYEAQLQAGMGQGSCEVKSLCCHQLQRVAMEDKSLVMNNPEFLQLLIDCVCVEAEGPKCGELNKLAAQTLVLIGTTDVGGQCLFSVSSIVLTHLRNTLAQCNSTIWFRLMQVVLDCCVQSPGAMRICETNSLLHMLIAKLNDLEDILSQAVAVEMLTDLACCRHGFGWLSSQDVFPNLLEYLEDDENPFASLIQPVVLKFFASVSRIYPDKVYADDGRYFVKLCSLITEETGSELLVNALDALTGISSTGGGKLVLNKLGSRFTNTVRRVGQLARTGASELRLVSLHCIAALMSVPDESDPRTVTCCETWFDELDTQPLEFLLKISTTPIMEPRLITLGIYKSIASQAWGQKVMRDHPTFCEYLLDRSTEKEKEGFDMKFGIIRKLISSPTVNEVFTPQYILKLKLYERQGPLFVLASSQVAMDEA